MAIALIKDKFVNLTDARTAKNAQYAVSDVGLSAVAVFFCKIRCF